MKIKALFVLFAFLAVTIGAFAAEGTGKITLRYPVQMNGKQLAAGEYKVKWTGNGPSVDVTVMEGKKTVANTTAKVKELQSPAPYDSVMYKPDGNGKAVAEVQFGGKKAALIFDEGQAN